MRVDDFQFRGLTDDAYGAIRDHLLKVLRTLGYQLRTMHAMFFIAGDDEVDWRRLFLGVDTSHGSQSRSGRALHIASTTTV